MTAAHARRRLDKTTTRVNGTAIRVIRERTEMSVDDVVARIAEEGIEVNADHIRNIELGRKHPSPELFGAIARAIAAPKRAILVDPDAPQAEAVS